MALPKAPIKTTPADVLSLIVKNQDLQFIHNLRSTDREMHENPVLKAAEFVETQIAALSELKLDPDSSSTELISFREQIRTLFQDEPIHILERLANDKLVVLRSESTRLAADTGFAQDFPTWNTLNKLKISIVEQEMSLREYELQGKSPVNQFEYFQTKSDLEHVEDYSARLKSMYDQKKYQYTVETAGVYPDQYTEVCCNWFQWQHDEDTLQRVHSTAALFTSQPEIMKHHVQTRYLCAKRQIFDKLQSNFRSDNAPCTLS